MSVYSFKDVAFFIGPIPIDGFADGDDVITVSRREDSTELTVGVGGDGVFSVRGDRSAEISFNLLQKSAAGVALSALVANQESGVALPLPILIKDMASGVQLVTSPEAMLKRPGDQTFGANQNSIPWVIVANEVIMVSGT